MKMSCRLDFSAEEKWEGRYLKHKCKERGLEEEFLAYTTRIRANYLSVFLSLNVLLILFHSCMLLTNCDIKEKIYLDVGLYLSCTVTIPAILWINFKVEYVKKHKFVPYLTTCIAVANLMCVDLLLHFFHTKHDYWNTTSFLDTYIIIMVYMFLPIPAILPALGLGSFVSLTYILFFLDAIYLTPTLLADICLNLMGTFFRIIRNNVVRSSFLDRHQYVMEDIMLRSAREKEKLFLHSILPEQIALPIQADIRNRIKMMEKQSGQPMPTNRERLMAIQIHPDVSILYADVVNYTHLTTTLTVKALVTLLHEIYARFDKAALRFSVQRIKFLGDCYYCVAGLTTPDPDHAKCCIDLGLCIIDNIREVRVKQNIDIDIRVGVHSGYIFAGVIGAAKLQYDIWGNDVIIANHLEGTGVPSHIHTSERTLQMITEHSYEVLPGTQKAREDPYLIKHNITTYVIRPNDEAKRMIDFRLSDMASLQTISSAMNTNRDRRGTVEYELSEEFKKMPLGPESFISSLKQFVNWKNHNQKDKNRSSTAIGFLLMHFHDAVLEYNYMLQPDYLLKYTVLLAWFILICLVSISIIFDSGIAVSYPIIGIVVTIYTVILFITWFKKLCFMRYSTRPHIFNRLCCLLFRLSDNIQRSLVKRMGIYMITLIAYFSIISMMLLDCDKQQWEVAHIESKLYHYEEDIHMCFRPWVLTNIMCPIIGMSLIFTRLPFMLKVIISSLEAITYVFIMLYQFEYITHNSLSTNPTYPAEYAHSTLIFVTLIGCYLKERQTEFNNKINYKWRVELVKKQHDTYIADQSIVILLHNILPAHVVNVYLTSLAKHELYYEDYEMVAVMFASLKNFQLDLPKLRVLNEIISEFDRILTYYRDDYLVEKIKIVGCTYMAACGLDLRFSTMISETRSTHESVIQEVLRARRSLALVHKDNYAKTKKREEVAFVLTTFALDLMRTLWACNNDYQNVPVDREIFDADISIGISTGEVMAGVVGASQVHYDIWGNAVNMASRMDSTGVAGQIQVTEETAEILKSYGLECNYRGMTFVKGRGILPTYFVGIDENYEFRYIRESTVREASYDPTQSSEDSSRTTSVVVENLSKKK